MPEIPYEKEKFNKGITNAQTRTGKKNNERKGTQSARRIEPSNMDNVVLEKESTEDEGSQNWIGDAANWFYKYESTREWLRQKNIKEGTIKGYQNAMACYCEWRGIDPDGLAGEVEQLGKARALKHIQGLLSDYQEHLKTVRLNDGTGYAHGTIKLHVTALKSFYSIIFGHKILVKLRVNANERKNDKHIPDRLELRRILDVCDFPGKTLTLFQATTGMRVGDMVSLRIKDVEPALSDDTGFFPVWYTPEKNGSSTGKIFTIVPPCATTLLRQYLKLRKAEGEVFGPDTPTFVSSRKANTPISKGQVNYNFKKAVKAAGILSDMQMQAGVKLSDKELRSYFFNTLEGAGMQSRIVQYMGAHTVEYNSAYQHINIDLAIKEYRKYIGSIDPFYDADKEEAIVRAESLEARIESLAQRMEKLETGLYSREVAQAFSALTGVGCETEIVSSRRKLDECMDEGCLFMSHLGDDRYLIVKQGVKQDG